jgi:elongation factor G
VWQQAVDRHLPRLVFINKLDRVGADFDAVVAEIGRRLGVATVPMVVPLFDANGQFAGLGDAIRGSVQWFDGRPPVGLEESLRLRLRNAHDVAIEVLADGAEDIMAAVVEGREVPTGRLLEVLREQFLAGAVIPIASGSALWNRGVDWLLDAVVALFPRPAEVGRGLWSIEAAGEADAPSCAFVFKVHHLDRVWNYLRIVRGVLRVGDRVAVARDRRGPLVVEELWLVRADRHESVASAGPGEIVVWPGDLGLRTGDTVGAEASLLALPWPRFPAPVLAMEFEPQRAEDRARLAQVLRELATDDPTLRVDVDRDRIQVRGMGELHLDVVTDLVRERSKVQFHCSAPRVEVRQRVVGSATGQVEVNASVAGEQLVAWATVLVCSTDGGAAAEVVDRSGVVGAEAALAELRQRVGPLRPGGRLSGVRVDLLDLGCRGPRNDALLEQAAARALDLALADVELVRLEPWVALELWCPEEGSAPVLADLQLRRAQILQVSSGQLGMRLAGRAPLSRLLGYITRLRSMTRGRGQVALRPDGFGPVS